MVRPARVTFDPEDDYDGRDLREVVLEKNFAWPSYWPAQGNELEVVAFVPQYVAGATTIPPQKLLRATAFGPYVIGWQDGHNKANWLAPYLHFKTKVEFVVYGDTHGTLAPFVGGATPAPDTRTLFPHLMPAPH